MKSELLLKIKRGRITEREHSGFLSLTDENNKVLSQVGDCENISFFLRSCSKPIQAIPVLSTGAFDRFKLTLPELAVICASHTASKEHLTLVKSILKKIGLGENNLQCGIHEPIDIETRNYLIKNNLQASPIHNNCSGKHTGMLASCMAKEWNVENYLDFNHPLQKEYIEIIKNLYKISNNELSLGIDGCGAPVFGMPFYKIGTGLLKLFLAPETELIKQAFMQNPILIGGKGRLDSEIIKASHGKLIAKVGAEGLCIVINPEKKQALAVKILDANMQARSITVIEALKQLGWLSQKELNSPEICSLYDLSIKNCNNVLVGKKEIVFHL